MSRCVLDAGRRRRTKCVTSTSCTTLTATSRCRTTTASRLVRQAGLGATWTDWTAHWLPCPPASYPAPTSYWLRHARYVGPRLLFICAKRTDWVTEILFSSGVCLSVCLCAAGLSIRLVWALNANSFKTVEAIQTSNLTCTFSGTVRT